MALVLKDKLLINTTTEEFEEVLESKFHSATYLDEETRKTCPELDYFVCFSSVASGFGNSGQTSYGMGNSAMERLCELRKQDNLPALAVQFGPIAEVGALEYVNFDILVRKSSHFKTISMQ